jgi:arylformamidase
MKAVRIIDLTHALSPDMPVYPGDAAPSFEIRDTIPRNGYESRLLHIPAHNGTHLDAPSHIISGGASVDELPAGRFVGRARVISLRPGDGALIGPRELEPFRHLVEGCRWLLIRTGWGGLWGTDGYYLPGFPTFSPEGAAWLAGLPLTGVGLDLPSVDRIDAPGFPIHRILLGRSMAIVENLANLDLLPDEAFTFVCLPLPIEHGDGSPVRAVAILNEGTDPP